MYRWKENLVENRIHFKYLKNIQILRFGKILEMLNEFKLLEYGQVMYHFEARDLEIPNIYQDCNTRAYQVIPGNEYHSYQ